MTPAIVVVAYRRPASLARLLTGLRAADYPADTAVPLVISIDGGPDRGDEGVRLADAFDWPAGPIEVHAHDRHLGLTGHLLWCGDLANRFGAVAILEEDLAVSPRWHAYASASLSAIDGDPRIALAILGAPWFNGFSGDPFTPLEDGADAFYGRFPFTAGLAITADHWARLRPALADRGPVLPHPDLHPAYRRLGRDEWLPRFARHLVAEGRHVLYPRVALAVQWGDAGTHFDRPTRYFQASLDRRRADWTIHPLDAADAVYDGFMELDGRVLRRLSPLVEAVTTDVDVDLCANRRRSNVRAPFVVTTRRVRRAVATWGAIARPLEANIIDDVPGDAIRLARAEDVDWSRLGTLRAWATLDAWAAHDRPRGLIRQVGVRAVGRLEGAIRRARLR
jgi:hypothetical protein